ncbi:methylenetetrahydrofolate reductase C-terminal domain-containing protein [Alsobacter sp. SYSU M60028]|uniref:Methylenetetrahydrofolate reductase C-terminal domain-containing protein n=2 Tax=Alsobacter ponti TaxID=2962936 RepID=A0ABT1LFE3_9HYPH|nr:methylenetetrahydrofolate reductase C-terminal domain-containing protein [Alsobacter ponti]MCP8940214.1 methylenetetrahydrofolate reductase C-terminal domain-containing protein [Alsobacter ponti]
MVGSWRPRLFAVRHAAAAERFYAGFERVLLALAPLARRVGYDRAEGTVALVERAVKGPLFDCRMCGQCVLSSTGMSCPMNCPKALRNGPCGGVRQDGTCEVYPDMPCVWVQAWEGSRRMADGDRIAEAQPPVDHRLKGTSSWLRVMRAKRPEPAPEGARKGAATG